jgi:hypothetical protein
MTDPGALAVSLARPVVRGLLPVDQAEAAIAVALRNADQGALPGIGTFEERLKIDCHILKINVDLLEARRCQIIGAITSTLRPLIAKLVFIGRLRAEAHDINAEGGGLLTDADVEAEVVHLLYQARERITGKQPPPKRRRRRYG